MAAVKDRPKVKGFRIVIESPLVQRISVDVEAVSAKEAMETVAGWIKDAMTAKELRAD